jgi:hypothetical protein
MVLLRIYPKIKNLIISSVRTELVEVSEHDKIINFLQNDVRMFRQAQHERKIINCKN